MDIKRKKLFYILSLLAFGAIIVGIFLMVKNKYLAKEKIEIIDATYKCDGISETFYEEDGFIYSFPCTMSTSTFVKFANGNKMLVTTALEEEKVTIKELIKAGLKVNITEK